MVVHVSDGWAEEDKQEAHWNGHLQHRLQRHRLLQPHKSHGWLVQEVHPACGDSDQHSAVRDKTEFDTKLTQISFRLPVYTAPPLLCFALYFTLYFLYISFIIWVFWI